MRFRRVLAVATMTAAATAVTAVPASATGSAPSKPTTSATIIGPVIYLKSNPHIAYIPARYRCFGEGSLWISVKQTASRKADPVLTQEGSAGKSAAWLDSHRNSVNCDGRTHVQVFTVDQLEPGYSPATIAAKKGAIARGKGYVQFCLFDKYHPSDAAPFTRNAFKPVVRF